MKGFKKFCVFMLFFALLCTATLALFTDTLTDMAASAVGQRGNRVYSLCAAGEDGSDYYIRLERGNFILRRVDISEKVSDTKLFKLDEPFSVADISVAENGAMLMGVYVLDGVRPLEYRLYASRDGGETASLLLNFTCTGNTADRARGSVWRSKAYCPGDGTLSFFVYNKGDCRVYKYDTALDQGVTEVMGFMAKDAVCGAYLKGTPVYADASGGLYAAENDESTRLVCDLAGYRCTELFTGIDGCAFIDALTGGTVEVHADGTVKPGGARAMANASRVCVRGDMSVISLVGNDGLIYSDADGVSRDMDDLLNRSRILSALALVGIVLAEAVTAYGFCYIFCEANGMCFPLALRGFLITLLLGFWCATLTVYMAVAPAYAGGIRQSALDSLDVYTAQLKAGASCESTATAMAVAALDGRLFDALAEKLETKDGELYIAQSSAINGEGLPANAYRAAAGVTSMSGETYYRAVAGGAGGETYAVSVNAAIFELEISESIRNIYIYVYAATFALALVCALCLSGAARGVRRVQKGIDLLSQGVEEVRIVNASGDELEALCGAFNDLSGALNKVSQRADERNEAYRRFVPSQLFTLLGAKGIEDVDKSKSASLTLAMLVVRFRFPQSIYSSDDKTLFENINGVFERVGAVVTKSGGAIYNFTYDGFDAVFEKGPLAAVSAAVLIRQETLELNAERMGRSEPPFELRVAVDHGAAMLGVVGDRDRMVPTVASACLSTARELVELAQMVDANILCTAPVAEAAKEYRVRYIGKHGVSESATRVYEVTDGDEYAVRLAKESVREQFAGGVYALYARDFSTAKRVFMDIAKSRADDGVAKHYLYLADSYEKDPPEEVSL